MSIANPPLPDGWTSEADSKRHTVIRSPDGTVTIDWGEGPSSRGFRAGWSTSGPLTSTKKYDGRGWAERLVRDAVKWLQDANAWRASWRRA